MRLIPVRPSRFYVFLVLLIGHGAAAANEPKFVKGADNPPRDLGAARLGMTLAELQRVCTRSSWRCAERRRARFVRMTATIPKAKPGDDFERLKFILKDGKVVAVTGLYRKPANKQDVVPPWARYKALARTFGPGSRDRNGQTRWVSTDGRNIARLSASGKRLSIVDLSAAVQSGIISKTEAYRASRRLQITAAVASTHGTTLDLEPTAARDFARRFRVGSTRTGGPRIPAWAIRVGDGAILVQPVGSAVFDEGAATNFAVGLTNIGTGDVTNRRVELYVRAAGTEDWTRVARSNAPAIRPGFHEPVTLRVDLAGRNSRPVGQYDGEIRIEGGDKSFAVAVTIEPTSPNFTIASMTADAEALPQTDVRVTVSVRNNGTASEGRVRVVIRADGEPESVTVERNEPVAAGQEFTSIATIRLPEPNRWGGSVRIKARVISREDSNPDDNRASVLVRTPAPPAPPQSGIGRISVAFTVDELECLEQDDGALFGGDDEPYIFITGLHSRELDRETRRVSFEEVSTEDDERQKRIGVTAFDGVGSEIRPATGRRRIVYVTPYEWTGLHLSFWESDRGTDAWIDPDLELPDEPDDGSSALGTNATGYHVVDFATARAYAGRTTHHEAQFAGFGSRYVVRYSVTYGRAETDFVDRAVAEHKFRPDTPSFSPARWATSRAWVYDLRIGTDDAEAGTVALEFRDADKSDRTPTGRFTGTVTIGRRVTSLSTTVLLDWFFEFTVSGLDAGGAPQRFVGYLMREGDTDNKSKYRIAGTTWHAGLEQGFVMTMRAK
ncbi:MAG: hypothetical protein HYY84_08745 [Deltaproteobacteria bacterium]|nr:hypothetical protein [Deltaproteobacteria bacterium]